MADETTMTTTETDAPPADEAKAGDTALGTTPPEGDTPAEGDTKTDATDEAGDKTPDNYTLALGENSLLESKNAEDLTKWAKEQGFSKEVAQQILDEREASAKTYKESSLERMEAVKSGWLKDAKADKEFGGEKFDESIKVAVKAIEAVADDEVRQMLEATGLGNHPAFIRMFRKIGMEMSNDSFVKGGSEGSGGERSASQVLYGNSK